MESNFDYKISTAAGAVVVVFKGKLCKESIGKMETCRQEIIGTEGKHFVLFFRDVTGIDLITYRELTLLQQEIRKKNASLAVAGLALDLRSALSDKAVVRPGELKKSLEEALKAA